MLDKIVYIPSKYQIKSMALNMGGRINTLRKTKHPHETEKWLDLRVFRHFNMKIEIPNDD